MTIGKNLLVGSLFLGVMKVFNFKLSLWGNYLKLLSLGDFKRSEEVLLGDGELNEDELVFKNGKDCKVQVSVNGTIVHIIEKRRWRNYVTIIHFNGELNEGLFFLQGGIWKGGNIDREERI